MKKKKEKARKAKSKEKLDKTNKMKGAPPTPGCGVDGGLLDVVSSRSE